MADRANDNCTNLRIKAMFTRSAFCSYTALSRHVNVRATRSVLWPLNALLASFEFMSISKFLLPPLTTTTGDRQAQHLPAYSNPLRLTAAPTNFSSQPRIAQLLRSDSHGIPLVIVGRIPLLAFPVLHTHHSPHMPVSLLSLFPSIPMECIITISKSLAF